MELKTFILLAVTIVALGLTVCVNGQAANYGMFPGGGGFPGGGYPGGGGFPGGGGYPGGGGWPGYPGHGGWPGYPGHGGWPGYPGHGGWPGSCQCRRYCFRGERFAGRCHRRPRWGPYHGGGRGRRLVRCCPMIYH